MALLPPRASMPSRSKSPVLSVGQRAFVSCRTSEHGAVLTDDAGRDTTQRLADGTEVEILAWRPRGSSGTRYRIHSTREGFEGWLQAGELRGALAVVATAEPPPRPEIGRKFGQRR